MVQAFGRDTARLLLGHALPETLNKHYDKSRANLDLVHAVLGDGSQEDGAEAEISTRLYRNV